MSPARRVKSAEPADEIVERQGLEGCATGGANVAGRLSAMAALMPQARAVVVPRRQDNERGRLYEWITFRELDRDSDQLARGLRRLGAMKGMRLALLVRPGIEFVTLVFALFKAGAVAILVDPGMGRRNLLACLAEAEPEGFVAIPLVQAVRRLLARRFPRARLNVTVGRRWFWGCSTLDDLRRAGAGSDVAEKVEPMAATSADDPAAIIFTSGSTGPPKGVLYTHGNFDRQVMEIRDFYGIRPGEVDLAGFPLFGLFDVAMGVTTVIPDMDASRPAQVDPAKIVEAIGDCRVTQSFGSPAIWNRVGPYCARRSLRLPTLKRVLSAGAPVPPRVLERMKACIADDGEVHTPYGATEALPVASIAAGEVLSETAARTAQGAGTCVGRRFPGIEWKVVRAVDGPIASLADVAELPPGETGELVVRGPVVTRSYVTRVEWNALTKVTDGATFWHRMGDVGYLDERDRFWYCGRLSQGVLTADGPMYTDCCEAVFNQHPAVFRSALVGIGPRGRQRPAIICEPWPGKMPRGKSAAEDLAAELRSLGQASPTTRSIHDFLFHRSFPVDVRHNAKIFREKLADWAAGRVKNRTL